ncbi:RagB/SusD family nutrient uptake outer membrane protein [Sphingobacterium sp. xlx-130]|uniref:RagB/SusD family nutrient uptake outer membrane protein n=1 Tax=Sphingobacterium sp. xlx-130 TaxID=2654323 RepID=UPI0013DD599A|nr:RagB/SusD family nutrient uptake outer membrane protein [Sphingobacterium sp. xlx-130]
MKNIRILLSLASLFFILSSCSKWLDVKPEDKFIEEDVFSTPQGFYDALNGIYMNLGKSSLYGSTLTLDVPDVLARMYAINSLRPDFRRPLNAYNYEEENVQKTIDRIWSEMYANIANINVFISNLERKGAVLDKQSLAIMKGEALAARAYLYFDLLRMFAPAYAVDPLAERLPYYDKVSSEIVSYSTTKDVLEKILIDLELAAGILQASDPVMDLPLVDLTGGKVELGEKPFLTFRNYHFNYYAVKALEARIHLYKGDKADALAAAETVIGAKSKFPWVTVQNSTSNKIFSTEMLFGFENTDLYNRYRALFAPSLDDNTILAAGTNDNFLKNIFENWENDLRFGNHWVESGGKNYKVFIKYQEPSGFLLNYKNTVPGIGLAEVFLIAAECTPDSNKALTYLNELLTNRKCDVIADPNGVNDRIGKEYRKEFYGQGQLWFYYKRNQASSILDATNNTNYSIRESVFTFPIPLSETEPR